MAIYAIGIIPLLLMLVDQAEQLPGKKTKSVAYADDFTGAGSIKNLLHWWNTLTTLGPLFGYHPELTKCWLIVKPRMKDIALKTFENTGINITEDGMRHLGAVIGTIEYRENYVTQKVNNWLDELNMLCDRWYLCQLRRTLPSLITCKIWWFGSPNIFRACRY